jgi:hypothetical protein
MIRGATNIMRVRAGKIVREEEDLQLLVGGICALLPGVLYLVLPTKFIPVGPPWLLLVIEALLVAPSAIARLVIGRPLPYALARGLAITVLLVVTAALGSSVALLVGAVAQLGAFARVHLTGTTLLRSAAVIWGLNVLVFALWYWEVDSGGPLPRFRARSIPEMPDFLFPQQQRRDGPRWKPGFVDYIFLAFCFSTALSPADSMPLTHRGKLLMMAQALISLLILVLLVGRSVNII